MARSGRSEEARRQIAEIQRIEEQLQKSGNVYWATQARVMKGEVMAWSAQAEKRGDEALDLLREAADEEDSVEKLPVTPGPIVPAREQLGELLLEQGKYELARKEFQAALRDSPGRRGALRGMAEAENPRGR